MNRPESAFTSQFDVTDFRQDANAFMSLRKLGYTGTDSSIVYQGGETTPSAVVTFDGEFPDETETLSVGTSAEVDTLYDRISGKIFRQSDDTLRPSVAVGSTILKQNGEPYIRFVKGATTTSDRLTNTNVALTNSFSIFLVFIPTDVNTTFEVAFSKGGNAITTNRGVMFFYRSTSTLVRVSGDTQASITGSGLVVNTPYIFEIHGNGSTAEMFINGVSQGSALYSGSIEDPARNFNISTREFDNVLGASMKFFGLFLYTGTQLARREQIYDYLREEVYSAIF